MTKYQPHEYSMSQDLFEIATEKLRTGKMDRRQFLQVAAGLGLVSTVDVGSSGRAEAAKGEFVVVNYGGPAADAFKQAFGAPFEKSSGLKFVVDGSGPTIPKIRAMVESKAVVWDACDTATVVSIVLGNGGYFEPIDYNVVDKAKILPGFALPYGVANYMYSYVISYTKSLVPSPPKTWADFFDVKKFPGMRTMSKMAGGQLEAALLADGVAPDKLFPLDVDRAIAKIKSIKDKIIFWNSGSESLQLFRDHEVVMGNIWNTRAFLLLNDMKGDFEWTWNQGILNASAWNIPKGNPAGAAMANRFVAATQDPEQQIALFKLMGYGPANPAAAALVPADLKHLNPMDDEALTLQIPSNAEWCGPNNEAVPER
jgi:putative spermidine/putrescine transport system substrate-binding protein